VRVSRDQALSVATAFLSLLSIVGFALYGLPFFYDFFVKDLGWTRSQVTSGNALSRLVIGPLFGLLAGTVVDRFGPRRLMLFGIIAAGLALVGLGGVTTLGGFYFFYLLNALGYVCGGPLPNQVLLSRRFVAGRGKAMGVAYLGIGVGGTLVPLVAHALVEALGWRAGLRALGLLMIAVALPCAFFVRDPEVEAAPKGAPPTESLRAVLGTKAFYLLALGSMCSIGAVGGTMQNLKLFLTLDRGFTQESVAKLLSLILFGSLAGRLLFGWLADRWAKKHVMLLVYAIVAATIPLFIIAPSVETLSLGAFLFGTGLGGDYMMIPLMAAELFGVKVLGRLLGIVLTADGVAEAVAPMGVAWLRDTTGAYSSGFLLLAGLAVAGAIAIAWLPRGDPGETAGAR
jgi:MFS family permease